MAGVRARAGVCRTERKSEFRRSTRSCRALTTTGCCCCWRPPRLTRAQDGRHRSWRACAPRPSVRQVVPPAALRPAPKGRPRAGRIFFSTVPRTPTGRRTPAPEGPRLHASRRCTLGTTAAQIARRVCAPTEYRYADRRVAARKAPEIPRPSRARPAVRIAGLDEFVRCLHPPFSPPFPAFSAYFNW